MPAKFQDITFIILRNIKYKISLDILLVTCFFNNLLYNSSDFDTIEDRLGYISYRFKGGLSYTNGYFYWLYVSLNLTNIPFYYAYGNGTITNGLRLIIHNDSIDPGYYGGISKNGLKQVNWSKKNIHI